MYSKLRLAVIVFPRQPNFCEMFWIRLSAPFSQVSLAKAYDRFDSVYYGRLYDSAGNALTSGNYYWYGSSYNYDGGSSNATFYRHT